MSSTADTLEQAVVTRFAAQFPTVEPNVLIEYENGTPLKPLPSNEWLRLMVKFADSRQAAFTGAGYATIRDDLMVLAQIFIPLGVGTARLTTIFDELDAIFRVQTIAGITYRKGLLIKLGQASDGPWYQGNAVIYGVAHTTLSV